ncbi:6-pyruvoyl-tetrahydropterin synthase-related protein [uncultured Phenylobacterium sp.]|uniref:6-pyruvoyl-tetrahydropterin synthase-related protein n=1 Tax=uncultured Phenylobacterium sp. TaxID=349273 RepID=UPI0025D602E9|nr:6-pyruvoyl-tetrahydropterin synthase-related protein [uncultured Phenylobacterium sp.]
MERFGPDLLTEIAAGGVQLSVLLSLVYALGSWPLAAALIGSLVALGALVLLGAAWPVTPVQRALLPQRAATRIVLSLAAVAVDQGSFGTTCWLSVVALLGAIPATGIVLAKFAPAFKDMKEPNCGRNALLPPILLALLSVVALSPGLGLVGPISGHDAYIQSVWQQLFAEHVWRGEIYPRWLPEMSRGLGSPVFFMYPPFGHYVTAVLLYPIAPDRLDIYLRLAMSLALASFVGALGVYLWLRRLDVARSLATLGAAAFVLAPYHLFVDAYLRTAFAEAWAFAWEPWVFLGLADIRKARGWIVATLAMAAAILSHLPSALFLFPAFGVFALIQVRGWRELHSLVRPLAAVVVALALSGAYLATALGHGQYVDQAALFTGRYDPVHSLIGPGLALSKVTVSILLTLGLQVLLVAAAGAIILRAKPTGAVGRSVWYLLGVAVVTTLLMTWLSRPLWALGTMLNAIQFPWRLLVLQTLAFGMLMGLGLQQLGQGRSPRFAIAAGLVVVGILCALNGLLYAKFADHPASGKEQAAKSYVTLRDAPEYRLGDMDMSAGLFPPGRQLVVLSGSGDAAVVGWRSRHVEIDVAARTSLTVALRQYAYTGWNYRVDGGAWRPAAALTGRTPIMTVIVPPGRHRVEARLETTMVERYGWTASGVGVIVLLCGVAGMLLVERRRLTASQTGYAP